MRNAKAMLLVVATMSLGGCMVGCIEETVGTAVWLSIVNAITDALQNLPVA